MAAPSTPRQELWEEIQLVLQHGSVTAAAKATGRPRQTLQHRIERARVEFPDALPQSTATGGWARSKDNWQGSEAAFEYPNNIPSAEPTYEELKERLCEDFVRLDANRQASKLIKVRVKIDGPYGVMVKGDPHVDNPGTNWPLLNK